MLRNHQKLKGLNKEKYKVPRSVQDTIPIDTVYTDGIFRMGNKYYKSYRFLDINYSISSTDDKKILFLNYGEMLNTFDSSVMVKISVNNRKIDLRKFEKETLIALQNDELDKYRIKYNQILLEKLS